MRAMQMMTSLHTHSARHSFWLQCLAAEQRGSVNAKAMLQGRRCGSSLLTVRPPLRLALRLLSLVLQHHVLAQPRLFLWWQQMRPRQKLSVLRRQACGLRLELLSGNSQTLACTRCGHPRRSTSAGAKESRQPCGFLPTWNALFGLSNMSCGAFPDGVRTSPEVPSPDLLTLCDVRCGTGRHHQCGRCRLTHDAPRRRKRAACVLLIHHLLAVLRVRRRLALRLPRLQPLRLLLRLLHLLSQLLLQLPLHAHPHLGTASTPGVNAGLRDSSPMITIGALTFRTLQGESEVGTGAWSMRCIPFVRLEEA